MFAKFLKSTSSSAISSASSISGISSNGNLINHLLDNMFHGKTAFDKEHSYSIIKKMLDYTQTHYEQINKLKELEKNGHNLSYRETEWAYDLMNEFNLNERKVIFKEYVRFMLEHKYKSLYGNNEDKRNKLDSLLGKIDSSTIEIEPQSHLNEEPFFSMKTADREYLLTIDASNWTDDDREFFKQLKIHNKEINVNKNNISFDLYSGDLGAADSFRHLIIQIFNTNKKEKSEDEKQKEFSLNNAKEWMNYIENHPKYDLSKEEVSVKTRKYSGDSGGVVNSLVIHRAILPSVNRYKSEDKNKYNIQNGNLLIKHSYEINSPVENENFYLTHVKSSSNKSSINSRPLVILFPGNLQLSTDFSQLVDKYISNGIDVVMVDYPGVLGKGDKPAVNLDHAVVRGLATFNAMKNLGYNPDNIVLNGFSIGGNIATKVCSEIGKNSENFPRLLTTCSPESMASVVGGNITKALLSKENNSDVKNDYLSIPKDKKASFYVQSSRVGPHGTDPLTPRYVRCRIPRFQTGV